MSEVFIAFRYLSDSNTDFGEETNLNTLQPIDYNESPRI